MNAKFWAINGVAFMVIISYTISYFMGFGQDVPFWKSAFPLAFLGFTYYLITEGKMVQRVLLAKLLKENGTAKEYAIIDKSINKSDDSILDRFKKN